MRLKWPNENSVHTLQENCGQAKPPPRKRRTGSSLRTLLLQNRRIFETLLPFFVPLRTFPALIHELYIFHILCFFSYFFYCFKIYIFIFPYIFHTHNFIAAQFLLPGFQCVFSTVPSKRVALTLKHTQQGVVGWMVGIGMEQHLLESRPP